VLYQRHSDFDEEVLGEENPFDSEAYYDEQGSGEDHELHASWSNLEASLKTEVRLFNRAAEGTLHKVFEDLAGHRTRDGNEVLISVDPGEVLSSFFRARVSQSNGSLKSALRRPDRGLGPPSALNAMAGRMSARGMSVFYGATDDRPR